jgi:hypothetical protein
MAQRAWRISVDGATTCCGTVTLPPTTTAITAPSGGCDTSAAVKCTPRFVVSSFSAAPAVRLRDPFASLGAELLCAVFATLQLRQRLACAAVCRAWCDALCPGNANADAAAVSAWAYLDLSPEAFPLRRGAPRRLAALLVDAILPRYGRHVTHLILGHARSDADDDSGGNGADSGVTDAVLRAAAAACPRLALLDLRGCGALCRFKHGAQSDVAGTTRLGRLLCALYDAARPGTRLTLLLAGSAAGACARHGAACPTAALRGARDLSQALTWRVKTQYDDDDDDDDDDSDMEREDAPPWLVCDLAPCPLAGDAATLDECRGLMAARGPRARFCDFCTLRVCEGCCVHTRCPALDVPIAVDGARGGLCVPCDARMAAACWTCDAEACVRCARARCIAAPSCAARICDACAAHDARRGFMTACEECGAAACPAHTCVCDDCNDTSARRDPFRHLRTASDFRAVARCCACGVARCLNCDPGPYGFSGQAFPEEENAPGVCVFCCGWPAACSGRATELIDSCAEDVADAKAGMDAAEEEAAQAAAQAEADAFAAAEAADAAAAAAHAAAHSATVARFALRDTATAAAVAAEAGAAAAAAASAAAVALARVAAASAAAACDAARSLDDAEAELLEAEGELEAARCETQLW